MDNLDELPEAEYSQTDNEQKVMDRFFDKGEGSKSTDKGTGKTGAGVFSRINFKRLGAILVAFIAIANPWVDTMFEKIPYTQSPISKFGLKTLIFTILLLLITIFVK